MWFWCATLLRKETRRKDKWRKRSRSRQREQNLLPHPMLLTSWPVSFQKGKTWEKDKQKRKRKKSRRSQRWEIWETYSGCRITASRPPTGGATMMLQGTGDKKGSQEPPSTRAASHSPVTEKSIGSPRNHEVKASPNFI